VAKNDVSFVVVELIIALMRCDGLSTKESNALLLKLVSTTECPEFFWSREKKRV